MKERILRITERWTYRISRDIQDVEYYRISKEDMKSCRSFLNILDMAPQDGRPMGKANLGN